MTKSVTLALKGLHCAACVQRITAALLPHAQEVSVGLKPMLATVLNPSVSLDRLIAQVEGAGKYQAKVVGSIPEYKTSDEVEIPATDVSVASSNDLAELPRSNGILLWLSLYRPLLILGGLLAVVPLAFFASTGQLTLHNWMQLFMAGFFMSFAYFKLIDIGGFASAFSGYDLVAGKWPAWGYLYPFIELGLGLAYLTGFSLIATNWIALILMSASLIGVTKAVMSKTKIRCACLGVTFNLPMSTVTIVEGALMSGMAVHMLLQSAS